MAAREENAPELDPTLPQLAHALQRAMTDMLHHDTVQRYGDDFYAEALRRACERTGLTVTGPKRHDPTPPAVEDRYNDRALGYGRPLDSFDPAWLASEVRMLHERVRSEVAERRETEARYERRAVNYRHVLAHAAADQVGRWTLGKLKTAGALRLVEWVYPVSRCAQGCTGELRGAA